MGDHSARYLATAGETVHEGGCLPGDGDGDGDGHDCIDCRFFKSHLLLSPLTWGHRSS